MLIFLWNRVSHFQSHLPTEEDDVFCCYNSENPLSLSTWIRRELFLFVGQNQNSNVHVLQWDEVGWAISLPPNTEAKSLHLIAQSYSYSLAHMILGRAHGKCEGADGGWQCTANIDLGSQPMSCSPWRHVWSQLCILRLQYLYNK